MSSLSNIDIKILLEKFPCPVFFETGGHMGNGIRHACTFPFERIISVEINTEQAAKLSQQFYSDKRVKIYAAASADCLESVLPKIDENILFWNDAHYPSADLGLAGYDSEKNEDVRLPLEVELQIIKRYRKNYKDVILIDDLWIYRDYEKLTRQELKPRKAFSSKEFYKDIFADTHDCQVIESCEIYAILTPKV